MEVISTSFGINKVSDFLWFFDSYVSFRAPFLSSAVFLLGSRIGRLHGIVESSFVRPERSYVLVEGHWTD